MAAGVVGRGSRNRIAIPVEFLEFDDSAVQRPVRAIHAGIQVPDSYTCPRQTTLPASLDIEPLQPPGLPNR